MKPCEVAGIGHILLFARDAETSAQWYRQMLDMAITARSEEGPYAGAIFLSFGVSDHDLALFTAPPQHIGRELGAIGLELADAGDLASVLARCHTRGQAVEEERAGDALTGLRLRDPDGRVISLSAGSPVAN